MAQAVLAEGQKRAFNPDPALARFECDERGEGGNCVEGMRIEVGRIEAREGRWLRRYEFDSGHRAARKLK